MPCIQLDQVEWQSKRTDSQFDNAIAAMTRSKQLLAYLAYPCVELVGVYDVWVRQVNASTTCVNCSLQHATVQAWENGLHVIALDTDKMQCRWQPVYLVA